MSDNQNDLRMEKLCFQAQLGKIVGLPKPISGGLLHKMYAVRTTIGTYAIKLLNPEIMKRPEAMKNYMASERIAHLLSNNIPALPAKIIRGESVQEVNNQYYLVFNWIEGETLKPKEITSFHSRKIGSILADIHNTDFSELGIHDSGHKTQRIDWDFYLKKGQESNDDWIELLSDSIDKLYDWDAKSNKAAEILSSNTVISHRDLDRKNVMWKQDNPTIIDWESAGHINPMQDVLETAVYWAEDESGALDKDRFFAFIDGYKKHGDDLQGDWNLVVQNGFLGKLGWLEYNLKRAMGIECNDEEAQKLGIDQVFATIRELKQYEESIPKMMDWLNK